MKHSIITKVSLGDIELSMEEPSREKLVSWERASDDAKNGFKTVLQDKLLSIAVPASSNCEDLKCTTHTEDMEEYTMQVLEAVECASKECLPSSGGGNGGGHSSWVDRVCQTLC